jgi:hypothetical protein
VLQRYVAATYFKDDINFKKLLLYNVFLYVQYNESNLVRVPVGQLQEEFPQGLYLCQGAGVFHQHFSKDVFSIKFYRFMFNMRRKKCLTPFY